MRTNFDANSLLFKFLVTFLVLSAAANGRAVDRVVIWEVIAVSQDYNNGVEVLFCRRRFNSEIHIKKYNVELEIPIDICSKFLLHEHLY